MDWILILILAAAGGISTFIVIEMFRWGYNKENK